MKSAVVLCGDHIEGARTGDFVRKAQAEHTSTGGCALQLSEKLSTFVYGESCDFLQSHTERAGRLTLLEVRQSVGQDRTP